MRTTIDEAGRLVIPKELRDSIGLRPGVVELRVDGSRIRVDVPMDDDNEQRGDRLVIPASGDTFDDGAVRGLRDAGRR